MNITNLFKIALKAIGANKMRSFLTMLGIIIGVSSVIIMLALGHGAKETIKDQISDVDPAMFFISPGPDRLSGVKMTPEMQQTLTEADYKRILETFRQDKKRQDLRIRLFRQSAETTGI